MKGMEALAGALNNSQTLRGDGKLLFMRFIFLFVALTIPLFLFSQIKIAPERNEGEGPWNQLIIRGVILLDGTGAPPLGRADIVVDRNWIRSFEMLGSPGIAVDTVRCHSLL